MVHAWKEMCSSFLLAYQAIVTNDMIKELFNCNITVKQKQNISASQT